MALSDLFNPDLFLVAYKLQSAQRQKVSVDQLILVTTFEKGSLTDGGKPLKIRGLLLQGCTFSEKKLDDKEGSGSSAEYEILPVCYLSYVSKRDANLDKDLITVPLFTNLSREKMITEVKLPFTGSKSGLIIKSAALAISP